MWLLDVETRKLVYSMDDRQVEGKYAILSHTWDTEEVTFANVHTPEARDMKGYKKIEYTCKQAEQDGLKFAWVDTCCIDKTSSAELSEAINSMFKWYQMSAVCYVYFADAVVPYDFPAFASVPEGAFRKHLDDLLSGCRWFTRGWTLQEMIAPARLMLYDANWANIGLLEHGQDFFSLMAETFSKITGVPAALLVNVFGLNSYSLAERMSWAAHRGTTGLEDATYSLLGLLGINIPLLYGEGDKAFIRLQEELLRTSTDRSFLLWHPRSLDEIHMLLAPGPPCFRDVHGLKAYRMRRVPETSAEGDNLLTNRGLRVILSSIPCSNPQYRYAFLNDSGKINGYDALLLRKTANDGSNSRVSARRMVAIPTFEVVRASIPPTRAQEFSIQNDDPDWSELLIHRNARSDVFILDMERGIECSTVADGVQRGRAVEILFDSVKTMSLTLTGAGGKHNLHISKTGMLPKHYTDVWQYELDNGPRRKSQRSYSPIPGTKEGLRSTIWDATRSDLPSECYLGANTFILRIWFSTEAETNAVIHQKSLPTHNSISSLWQVDRLVADLT